MKVKRSSNPRVNARFRLIKITQILIFTFFGGTAIEWSSSDWGEDFFSFPCISCSNHEKKEMRRVVKLGWKQVECDWEG